VALWGCICQHVRGPMLNRRQHHDAPLRPPQVVRLGADSSAAEKAAWALYDACFDNPDNREAVRTAGGVPALVELLLHSGGSGPIPSAAWALAQLVVGSREAAEVGDMFTNGWPV